MLDSISTLIYVSKMSESIYSKSVLTDAIISLANVFKEAGFDPPTKIQVDSQTFDKLLAESMKLYDIDSKKAIVERKFSIADIIAITEEQQSSLNQLR
jgi:hypothetical protein